MAKYNIYAGLGGGFGGAIFQCSEEFDSFSDAEDEALRLASEEYESYGGMQGLFNEEEALDEDPDLTEDDLAQMESEDRDNWMEYYAVLSSQDLEHEEE